VRSVRRRLDRVLGGMWILGGTFAPILRAGEPPEPPPMDGKQECAQHDDQSVADQRPPQLQPNTLNTVSSDRLKHPSQSLVLGRVAWRVRLLTAILGIQDIHFVHFKGCEASLRISGKLTRVQWIANEARGARQLHPVCSTAGLRPRDNRHAHDRTAAADSLAIKYTEIPSKNGAVATPGK
jgi:hypothetical protein